MIAGVACRMDTCEYQSEGVCFANEIFIKKLAVFTGGKLKFLPVCSTFKERRIVTEKVKKLDVQVGVN